MPFKHTYLFLMMLLYMTFHLSSVQAQSAYQQGNHYLQVGVGYPNLVAGSIATFNKIPSFFTQTFISGKGRATPQFNIAYDYGLTSQISVGPYFGYAVATTPSFYWDTPEVPAIPFILPNGLEARKGNYSYRISVTSFGGKALYHTNLLDNIELYALVIVGINQVRVKEKGESPDAFFEELVDVPVPQMSYSGHVGARYHFGAHLGAYIEAGYGSNVINAGLSFRLPKNVKNEENSHF